jgi:hypothetical protein
MAAGNLGAETDKFSSVADSSALLSLEGPSKRYTSIV